MKSITLPIKGTYYYAADQAESAGRLIRHHPLKLVSEPDNAFDGYAVQIWLSHYDKRFLLGYIPRTHSRFVYSLLKHQRIQQITLQNSYRQYNRLFIDCQIDYQHSWLFHVIEWLDQFLNCFRHDKMRSKK